MGFPRDEGKTIRFKVARTTRGNCIYCREPVQVGDSYIEGVGGSNTHKVGVAHKQCYTSPYEVPAYVEGLKRQAAKLKGGV